MFENMEKEVLNMTGQETIAGVIQLHLRRIFLMVAAVVAIVGFSLYLFTSYVALVNDAGVVRGGSQRIVKQVLAGADASKTTAKIEGLLSGMSSLSQMQDNTGYMEDFVPLNDVEKAFTERLKGYEKRFDDAMDDDMNTADALGAVFELVKDANVSVGQGSSREAAKAALASLEAICDVLGILSKKEEELPAEIAAMVAERAEARKNKDWAKSDELRDKITKAGYILEDTKQGQKVRKDV